MVRNNAELAVVNVDGSSVCEAKFLGNVCEILAISRTGRFVAICLSQPTATLLLRFLQQNHSRLVVLDTVTHTLQDLLKGTQEQRFDEVSFGLRGWLSWAAWAEQGRFYKYTEGLSPVRPDRHSIQVYSVFNWAVGISSELHIEPDIDYPLDPQEQRFGLLQPIKTDMSLSSSASYLFSDRTIRLQDGSFLLALGFSPHDDCCSILTSHQKVLLPSSLQKARESLKPGDGAGREQRKPGHRTYSRLFDNNKKLGCLQRAYG
jgi:hypothetical protein